MSTIFVLGGDGFCGWPTALRLSKLNYNVIILDNFSRRIIDMELNSNSITNIKSLADRIKTWNQLKIGTPIKHHLIDLSCNYHQLCQLILEHQPSTLIHLAEFKSAPYSMKDPEHANLTIQHNISVTSNILNAIVKVKVDIHLIHLGTMGVYGYGQYGDMTIPEGYLNVTINGLDTKINHPYNPGSIYHMTKCLDNQMFHTYSQLYKLKITELHQGIVWGCNTDETNLHPDLVNRFDYDSDYGTVLNRLLFQTALDIPLTVYGHGGQMRSFIHINNTVDCICLALQNDNFNANKVRIFNQTTECHTLSQLVKLLVDKFSAKVEYLDNPRSENENNHLVVNNQQLLDYGLVPIYLNSELLVDMVNYIKLQIHKVNYDIIKPISFWPEKQVQATKENSK